MNKYILSLVFVLGSLFNSVAQSKNENATVFLDRLKEHCGKTYQGVITSTPVPEDFGDKKLIMQVQSCDSNEVKVPFHVGEDHSRTWVFTLEDQVLTLKHDHRHPDGTPEEITMYGGTATNTGLEHIQFFPADQHTANLIPTIAGNVWWVEVTDTLYSYNLKRVDKESFFRVEFDLTKPL